MQDRVRGVSESGTSRENKIREIIQIINRSLIYTYSLKLSKVLTLINKFKSELVRFDFV